MRTTIDLPDELLRQVKSRAALSGMKLKELIARYVEEGLLSGPRRSRPDAFQGRPLPVIIPPRGIPIPAVSPADRRRAEEEEDEAKHARSA